VRPARLPVGLGRRLRAFRPSLVLAGSYSFDGVAAAVYARRHRVPFGLWSGEVAHQMHNRSYPALRRREREWLARGSQFGVAYGWLAARYLQDLAPGLPVVIGRNTSVIDVPERSRTPDEGIDLLTVADLRVPEKGFETVVEALRLLPGRPLRLRVIGNRPPAALARAAAQDARITFRGPQPHDRVQAAYGESDVFVFPSRMDVFGLALAEAMAAGLATVASPIPGAVADLAVPGRNCLIAGARNAHEWADAIAALADGSALRESIGTAAQATIRRRWTMKHAIEGMMSGFRLGALTAEGAG